VEQHKNPSPGTGTTAAGTLRWDIVNNPYFYIGIIICLAMALYYKFVLSDTMLFGSDTFAGLDARVLLRESLTNWHQFPAWFTGRLGGMPTIDALFGDALYPPSLLLYATMPIYKALGIKIVLHVMLAGVFFFLLLYRGFKAHPLAAFIGALFYMLNPEFISHSYPGHDGKMFIIAWLPFIIWRMKALMDAPRLINVTLLSLGIAMALLTSHIQMTYFTLWGLFAYWVLASVLLWRTEKRIGPLIRPAVCFWLAIFLAIGVAFIQFYPATMFVRDAFSVRGVDRGFEYAASWSLHWPEIFSLWVPEFGNHLDYYWSLNPFKLNSEYAGAMALLFAIVAVAYKPSAWRWFWAGVAIFAALYSLAAHTPVFHIAYYIIPGVKKFRAASIFMFWFSFAVVMLSSLFFIDVMKDELTALAAKRKASLQKGILIALGAVTLLTLIFSGKGIVAGLFASLLEDRQKQQVFDANFSKNFVPMLWVWWFFAGTTLALLWGVLGGKVSKYAFLGTVLAIGCIDTMRIDSQFISVVNPRSYFYNEQTVLDLQQRMKQEPFRCYALPGAFGRQQNAEGLHGLEGVGGFHDNELKWYRSFRGDQSDRNYLSTLVSYDQSGKPYLTAENLQNGNAFLDIANVRYILTRQQSGLVAIENRNALRRISFATGYTVMKEDEIPTALATNRYDFRTTVALLEEPDRKPGPAPVAADPAHPIADTAEVSWKRYAPNNRLAEINVSRDMFVRLAEVYYPGWRISVDGTPAKIYRSDGAWIAFFVPQGRHTIEMIPQSLYLGKAMWVSFPLMAALLIYWTGFILLNNVRRRKASGVATGGAA
jgi:hypothetical protein